MLLDGSDEAVTMALYLISFVLILGGGSVCGCYTPLGGQGRLLPIGECTAMMELLQTHKDSVPDLVRKFIFHSRQAPDENNDQASVMVCCGDVINLNESVGATILRNFYKICGDNTAKRISFARETTLMQYPWAALLIYDTEQRFHCGGTLMTHRYVLTAAHCVNAIHLRLVGVRLGEHNLLTDPDCEEDLGGSPLCAAAIRDVAIDKVIAHPSYDSTTHDHDIALIRLKDYVEFGRSTRPLCFPQGRYGESEKRTGIITGWGATENSTHSNILMEATVPIYDVDHCQRTYRRQRDNWPYKICAAGDNDVHTCGGDSGGPLLARIEPQDEGRKFYFVQLGIISLGTRTCGRATRSYPSVFTKVAAYMDWIEAKLEM